VDLALVDATVLVPVFLTEEILKSYS